MVTIKYEVTSIKELLVDYVFLIHKLVCQKAVSG
ncbi:hypothetical protein ES703_18028 [subsurface metagenome]